MKIRLNQKQEIIKSLYKAILGRNPTKSEIQNRIKTLKQNPNLESHIASMIRSQEFSIMMLPYLVQNTSKINSELKLFFLHVPKTAGTSLRTMLSEQLGIPAYLFYATHGIEGIENSKKMEFWPFWAGHANISKFPDSHSGFTSFRETRSRLLSSYRQTQKGLSAGTNLRNNANKMLSDQLQMHSGKSENFNDWLTNFGSSICHYYIPNKAYEFSEKNTSEYEKIRYHMGTAPEWISQINNAPEMEIKSCIEHSMKRFKAASWNNDDKSLEEATKKLFGEKNVKLDIPRMNVFEKTSSYTPEIISNQSIEFMEELSRKDQIVFESAINLGIISEKMQHNNDEVFFNSAKRLGFEFENK
jgi:hypothetical protein